MLHEDPIQCLHELAVLGKVNEDLKTQGISAKKRLEV